MTIERRWLTPRETAEYIGYAHKVVLLMCKRGDLPAVRFGAKTTPGPDRREWRIDKLALDKWCSDQIEAAS